MAATGAFVTAQSAHAHPDVLVGAHLTFPALLGAKPGSTDEPSRSSDPFSHPYLPTADVGLGHARLSGWHAGLDGASPSPLERLRWRCHRRRFTYDQLLMATTLYWLSGSFASSLRFYAASSGRPWMPPHDRRPTLQAPTGIAVFPKELVHVPRELASEHANLVHRSEMPSGGHFAPAEEPQLLVDDLRGLFPSPSSLNVKLRGPPGRTSHRPNYFGSRGLIRSRTGRGRSRW